MSVLNLKTWFHSLCSCRCVGKKTTTTTTTIVTAPSSETPTTKMAEGGVQLYVCDICGQEGLTDEDMRSHVLLEHVEGAISCPFCDLEGTTVDEMNLHVNMEHLDFLTPTKENFMACGRMDIDDMTPVSDRSTDQPISSPESNGLSSGTDDNTRMESPLSPGVTSAIPQLPMEITVTSPANSPKKTIVLAGGGSTCGEKTRCSSPLDGEEQSRKRAKLYLDVPGPVSTYRNHNNKKDTMSSIHYNYNSALTDECGNNAGDNINGVNSNGDAFHCPLCEWQTTSPGEISRHVNNEHVDILSPNRAVQQTAQLQQQQQKDSQNNIIDSDNNKPSTSFITYECPICGMRTATGSSLEIHVNTKHVDILSPGKPVALTSPMSVDSLSDSSQCCPVCGMEFSDTNDLAVHVDGHFSADQTPGMFQTLY